jgi:hypothetical protein
MDITDPTFAFAYGGMITVIEPALAILAGCIPVMAPVFSLLTHRIHNTSPPHNKTNPLTRPGTLGGSDFTRLEEDVYRMKDMTRVEGRKSMGSSTEALTEGVGRVGKGAGLGGIKVRSDIVVDVESSAGVREDGFERFKIIP